MNDGKGFLGRGIYSFWYSETDSVLRDCLTNCIDLSKTHDMLNVIADLQDELRHRSDYDTVRSLGAQLDTKL